jgi:hypothetical protein
MTLFEMLKEWVKRKINPAPPRDHWTCHAGDLVVGPDFQAKINTVTVSREWIAGSLIEYRDLHLDDERVLRVEPLDSPDHTQRYSLVLLKQSWNGPFQDAKDQGITESLQAENDILEDPDGHIYRLLSRHSLEVAMEGNVKYDENVDESWYMLAEYNDQTISDTLLYVTVDRFGWHYVHRGNQVLPELYQIIEGTGK